MKDINDFTSRIDVLSKRLDQLAGDVKRLYNDMEDYYSEEQVNKYEIKQKTDRTDCCSCKKI